MKKLKFIIYLLLLFSGFAALNSCASQTPSSYLWKKDFESLKQKVSKNPDFAKRKHCKNNYCSYYSYYSLADLIAMYDFKGENADRSLLVFLLKNGTELENKDFTTYYINPLSRALRAGRNKIARLLIDAGSDIEDVDYMKNSALMIAAQRTNNKEIINYLIKKGANLNAVNKEGVSVLEKAAAIKNNEENIEILLKNGAAGIPKNDFKITPKYFSNIKVLLKYNISIISNNNYDYDIKSRHLINKIMKHYLSSLNAELNMENHDYMRTIHKLLYLDDTKVIEKAIDLCFIKEPNCKSFLDSYTYLGISPIMLAIEKNRNDLLNILLCKGADIDKQNKFGETALHIAIMLEKHDAIKILLEHNANTGLKDIKGNTAAVMYKESFGTSIPEFSQKENKCSDTPITNHPKIKKEKIIDLTPSEVQNNKN